MNEIPAVSNAEPGVNPHRGKILGNGGKDGDGGLGGGSLPLDNYPMSEFETGSMTLDPDMRTGARGEPVNLNPDIAAGDQDAAKFGMGRGPDGAN
jgi:hypothetical protein